MAPGSSLSQPSRPGTRVDASRTFLVVVRDVVDPSADGIAPHQPGVVGLQEFRGCCDVVQSGVEPDAERGFWVLLLLLLPHLFHAMSVANLCVRASDFASLRKTSTLLRFFSKASVQVRQPHDSGGRFGLPTSFAP